MANVETTRVGQAAALEVTSVQADSTPAAPRFETFDYAWALAHLGGDAALLAELAGLFVEESATLLPALRQAVAQRDARSIERTAHTLKGSAGNFGARDVCDAALALEQNAVHSDATTIEALCSALDRALTRFTEELSTVRSGH